MTANDKDNMENIEETKEEINEEASQEINEAANEAEAAEAESGDAPGDTVSEAELYAAETAKLNAEIAALKDAHLRLMAEFDNFKKRTAREKEALLFDATLICMNKFLPVLDNLIRAKDTPCSDEAYKSGVDMVFKSFNEALERMNVKKMDALNATFDPNFHNAVMHVEGDEYPENTVIEVFQEGYVMGERVIRPAMVKVAN